MKREANRFAIETGIGYKPSQQTLRAKKMRKITEREAKISEALNAVGGTAFGAFCL